MGAYYANSLQKFLDDDVATINQSLTIQYQNDRYYQLLGTQIKSWNNSIPLIKDSFRNLFDDAMKEWGVLLEYPLYRLRKRIDAVLIADTCIYVIELKIGPIEINRLDIRQVEEYALDLRDFHKESHDIPIVPILCYVGLSDQDVSIQKNPQKKIQPVNIVSIDKIHEVVEYHHRALQSYAKARAQDRL